MDRLNLSYLLRKYKIEKVSAQTIPNTFAEITPASLCAEQVNNRNSAGWKKANFIICSAVENEEELRYCLCGWTLLASQTNNQVLIIQLKSGMVRVFKWNCIELHENLSDIIQKYKLI